MKPATLLKVTQIQSITNGQRMPTNPIAQGRIQNNLRFHKMFL